MGGGERANVVQGVVLFFGSITFLIIQRTELGGLSAAHNYWSNPALAKTPRIWAVQHVPIHTTIVAYFDFVFKTTVAATMFPHLTTRLFAARSAMVIRKGMSLMVFTFFVVQLSSCITGWVAIAAIPKLLPGQSAFGKLLQLVATRGSGQAFAAAMLLASAVCAMMSTADSALLAVSGMWVRDIYTKYLRPRASQLEQIIFGKVVAVIALAIGVTLGNYSIVHGKPDLSGLFALQNVTPIHVAPAVWLGLHWRSLRGEAVLTGMVCGLGVTIGLVFSKRNVSRAVGSDMTKIGLSSAWLGFVVNIGLVIVLGLLMQHFPAWFRLKPLPPAPLESEAQGEDEEDEEQQAKRLEGAASADSDAASAAAAEAAIAIAKGLEPPAPSPAADAAADAAAAAAAVAATHRLPPQHVARYLDIGTHRDRTLYWPLFALMGLVLLFTVPFYRVPASMDPYVGAIGAWPFTSLLLSGVLAILGAITFSFVWEDYRVPREAPLPPAGQPEVVGELALAPVADPEGQRARAPVDAAAVGVTVDGK
ncbi:Sodium/pantothenate symporter [Tetrabaena socialis]|uniref:Sodium/pantothenate symporter n=1 Tax=Tetrabaena socialis TaxID=47790 RepID=A0A2J8A9S8_9CHLO|nr:Sodium/pantothenate symporter [Tetrabaena socialis]|eukprot:PNH09288.1 Sodium/pantothenate symporter [Tetrabaena socialis]